MLPWWIAETALLATLLALFAAVAGRWLRWGPALRHACWALVLIKLVTPPLWHWRWTWSRNLSEPAAVLVTEPHAPAPAMPLAVEAAIIQAESSTVEPVVVAPVRPVAVESGEAPPPRIVRQAAASPIGWPSVWQLAAYAWLAGTVLVTAGFVRKVRRLRRSWRGSVAAPAWLEAEVHALSKTLAVRAPTVSAVPALATPVLWCLGRPMLLIPKDLLASVPAERWRAIIAHELAHLRRGDPWVSRLELAAGLVWWWFPVYWWACRRLRAESDLACDAWVIWALPESRRDYAETLIDVCERFSMAPLPMPALGLGTRAGRSFERRLTMILHESVPRRASWLGLGMLAVLAIGVLPAWSIGQQPVPPAQAPPAIEQATAVAPVAAQAPAAESAPLPTTAAKPFVPNPSAGEPARPATPPVTALATLAEQCQNDLKQIGLAMHNYLAEHGHFPPIAIRSKDGKTPLLSWRVALLPYLEQKELYDQFHLDEPWYSPHNRPLVDKIPLVYASPKPAEHSSMTYYQAIASPGSMFDPDRSTKLAEIVDGTSNTILVVEARRPVIWTEPEDVVYNLHDAISKPGQVAPLNSMLGGIFDGNFNVLFTDGSVRFVLKDAPSLVLTAMATINGGEVIDQQALRGVGLGAVPTLQAMQEEIKAKQAELEKARERYRRAAGYLAASRPQAQNGQAGSQNAAVEFAPGAIPAQAQQRQRNQQGQPQGTQQGQQGQRQATQQGQRQGTQQGQQPGQSQQAQSSGMMMAMPGAAPGPHRIQQGDILEVEVLEALPGRPLAGRRVVRSDGTISLGFYGDLEVAGLTRTEAKVKLIQHMRKYLNEEVLGLVEEDETGKTVKVDPKDSDRVFVDEAPTPQAGDGRQEQRIRTLELQLNRVLQQLDRPKPKGSIAEDENLRRLTELIKQRAQMESRLQEVLKHVRRADRDPAANFMKRRLEQLDEQIAPLLKQLGLEPPKDDDPEPPKPENGP